MTRNSREKRAVRERMARTGENYTTALHRHRAEYDERKALCPCGCAVRQDDECVCADSCPCSPGCGYCDHEDQP